MLLQDTKNGVINSECFRYSECWYRLFIDNLIHTLQLCELVLCYVDFMLKNKSKENEILFIVIYCVRGKSIFSITQQNPVKAKDSS